MVAELEKLVLAAGRRACERQSLELASLGDLADRSVVVGRGAGGDATLLVDERFEQIALEEFAALADSVGVSFEVITEEQGRVRLGTGDPAGWLLIDPLDGSLNARRGLPSFCFSLAYADGPAAEETRAALVHDFGAGDTFEAVRGGGASLNGRPVRVAAPDLFEVALLESASPERVAECIHLFAGYDRVRIIGSAALTLCYLAAGRADAAFMTRARRVVDVAAGALIAKEAGAAVSMLREGEEGQSGPGLADVFRVLAATSSGELERLSSLASR